MSSIIGDISGDQPSGADGQTGGWVIPPLWADFIRGDTSVCGLTSLKGIPPMWDAVIKGDTPLWADIIRGGLTGQNVRGLYGL